VIDTTIVIPVRDDPLLPRAIASTPAEAEVIIAMTAPSGEAVERARRLAAGRRVRIEISETAGMAAGVNLGARAASSEKVVILDSDCRLLPGALEAYSAALDKGPFVRGVTLVERRDWWSKMAALGTERLNRVFSEKPRFFGPSIAFDRKRFLDLGGYDERMLHGSCDHEFALRLEKLGIPVLFSPEAVVIHQPITFRIDTRAHVGYGRGMRYIDGKYGGRYGLDYCLKRLDPLELYTRAIERGPLSVARALILGSLMLLGYERESSSSR
jgi:GT2 family glycosyltransferase